MSRDELQTYPVYIQNLVQRLEEIRQIARKNLEQSKEQSKVQYDRKSKEVKFSPNDQVYALEEPRISKFDPYYIGPFTICEITDNNAILTDEKGRKFSKHLNKLKPAHSKIFNNKSDSTWNPPPFDPT